MKLKLLGYNTKKEHTDAGTNDYQDHDEGGTYWILYFEDKDRIEYYKVVVSDNYGSCGSKYCGATWGDIGKLEKLEDEPRRFTKAKKEVFIEISNGNLDITEKDSKEEYDARISQLLSTKGEIIAESTGNGGCSYYPSGHASINKELFIK